MSWSVPSVLPVLGSNEIHVWKIDCTFHLQQVSYLEGLLSSDEVTRARRFQERRLYERFVITRGKLRQLLARYLGVSPASLIFRYTSNGKPFVDFDIHFNLSHSQDLAVFAISWRFAVGVDIEYKRQIEGLENLCMRFLPAQECDEILAHPLHERLDAFYAIWVKREAYTKVLGRRLFEVLLTSKHLNEECEHEKVMVMPFSTHVHYASALATMGEGMLVKYWHITHAILDEAEYL